MINIWEKGFEIERDGKKITIDPSEIREIHQLIKALNGQGTLQYWLDDMKYDIEHDSEWIDEDDRKIFETAQKKIDDIYVCEKIWDEYEDSVFCDSGEMEKEAVEYVLLNCID